VIAVCVTQQDDMHGAEARIVGPGDSLAGVIEYAYAARVFKNRRTIGIAELAGMRAYRRDLYVLTPSWKVSRGERERDCSPCRC
jgi:hypothetical protein